MKYILIFCTLKFFFGIAHAQSRNSIDDNVLENSVQLNSPGFILDTYQNFLDRQHQEQQAFELDRDALATQKEISAATQLMKDAAQSTARYTLLSTIFVPIGTLFVLWSLQIARRSNVLASKALISSRFYSHWEMRPYIYADVEQDFTFADNFTRKEDGWKLTFKISNFGKTPACVKSLRIVYNEWSKGQPAGNVFEPLHSDHENNVFQKGDIHTVYPGVTPVNLVTNFGNLEILEDLDIGSKYATIGLIIDYEDSFGANYYFRGGWSLEVCSRKIPDGGYEVVLPALNSFGFTDSSDLNNFESYRSM
ncbi:hypothetical protein [Palleronia sp. LCG004]|uniref:hypothetical protein n=1 Tax=Palleronia sp. LCG004 TaxID=3079304 RepID=UPI002943A139|nr:hypothetical protein [Palleronia sp. LCG004]WOI57143.1 hypothetical protein RVY76_04955 [Palleronia sp. LCG004]